MSIQLPPGRWIKRNEFLLDECPKCGKSKHCYWNTDKEWDSPGGEKLIGAGICHSCGLRWRGQKRFEELLKGKLSDLAPLVINRPGRGVMSSPGLLGRCAWDHPEARVFLVGRGVTEQQARELPIGWVPEKHVLLVPVDSLSPEYPRATLYRRIGNSETKWLPFEDHKSTVYGFGHKLWARGHHRGILLMEGIFDVLATGLWGGAVALLGTSLGMPWLCYLQERGVARVGLWLDPDEAGFRAVEKLSRELRVWGFQCVIVSSAKDPKRYRPPLTALPKLLTLIQDPEREVPASVGPFSLRSC